MVGPRRRVMLPRVFIDRLQGRCAKLAIGPSTLRGKGTTGVAAAVRLNLAAIDLAKLAVKSQAAFQIRLCKLTAALEARLPELGRAWGRARKALNIFLRDVTYNADLRDYYGLAKIRGWLEVPLDSHVALGLKSEREGLCLPPWRGIKNLRPEISEQYQAVATAIAKRYGISPVDLDVLYWRATQDGFNPQTASAPVRFPRSG